MQRLHQRGKFVPRHDNSGRKLTVENVENIFREVDVDGDGQVNFEESVKRTMAK